MSRLLLQGSETSNFGISTLLQRAKRFSSSICALNSSDEYYCKASNVVANAKNTLPLIEGVFGAIGEYKNSTFVDVACHTASSGERRVYSITEKVDSN
jgi:hypothetical protein